MSLITLFPVSQQIVKLEPRLWSLRVEGLLGPLLSLLAGLPVTDIEIEEPRIEDVLIKYYQKEHERNMRLTQLRARRKECNRRDSERGERDHPGQRPIACHTLGPLSSEVNRYPTPGSVMI